ncbi:MAG: endonuclease/exonuclease/phosphatase family protein [bacterium]
MKADLTIKRFDRRVLAGLVALTGAAAMLFGVAAENAQAAKGNDIRVMTRNLYLGADLSPGLNSGSLAELTSGAGEILRSVDATKFSDRAKQLAKEIRSTNPDLVGLQEDAQWRPKTPPVVYIPGLGSPVSATVRYDFLALLLAALNKGKPKAQRYSAAVIKEQFDFETPTDVDDDTGTCTNFSYAGGSNNGCSGFPGADLTGRLTMQDVIIVKAGVKVSQKASGTFGDRNGGGDAGDTVAAPDPGTGFTGDVAANRYTPLVAGGVAVPVTRGWTGLIATGRGSSPFRFVNTHLEAFGDPTEAKCLQAQELYDRVISQTSLPVVAVGDFNSDDDTVDGDPSTPQLDGTGWDRCAYLSLVDNGMRSLTDNASDSCCLSGPLLDKKVGYEVDFDHHIDHVLTNSARFSRVGPTKVTGNAPFRTTGSGPYWGSDHAGVYQTVRLK